ncbi:MAG TPA: NTF2-like N-terminal transpeptidase domain-containing protein, partial [Dehalococcoidia bacterium]|nr:NTF2-like N-terminal transpeptidase domain-containing protein [Dehalococcoidia bacterium]
MKRPLALLTILLLVSAFACGGGSGSLEIPRTPQETAERFLSSWKSADYDAMYNLLSLEAQSGIERQKFIDRYTAITEEARITSLDYELQPVPSGQSPTPRSTGTPASTMPFSVTFHTSIFSDIDQENALPLVNEEVEVPGPTGQAPGKHKEWRVQWSPSLFFAELDDRNLVHFFTRVPRRGGIYDRNGHELAIDAAVPVVGIVPEQITDKEAVITRLAQALSMSEADVRAKVESDVPSYYFVPVKSLPYGTPAEDLTKFNDMVDLGVVVRDQTRRVYPNGDSLAHTLGYLTEVSEDQLKDLAAKGYGPGDKIGAAGVEGQFDDQLAGERGALLATITPEG